MGNGKSKSQYGGVVVQTDQAFCITGTPVTGMIHVQIDQPFPAKKLTLKIKGKEKCKWYEQKTEWEGEGEDRHVEYSEEKHDRDKKIFEFEDTIFQFPGGTIPPGQYSFPFSFCIPAHCPSSAYYTGDNKAVGYVKYTCKAKFKAHDNTDVKDMKYKSRLVVRQMAPSVSNNIKASKECEIKKCCCCCSQGKCKLKVTFERNYYHSRETAKAVVTVDNSDCDADVENIMMKLVQNVVLNTDGGTYRREFTVLKKEFDGVDDEEKVKNKVLEINLADSHQAYQDRDDSGIKPLDQDERQLAEFLQPTTTGDCLEIFYTLKVYLKFEGICCALDNVEVSIAMFLQPPWLPSHGQLQAPQNWDPKKYEMHKVLINGQDFDSGNAQSAPNAYPNHLYPGQLDLQHNSSSGKSSDKGSHDSSSDSSEKSEDESGHSGESYKIVDDGEGNKHIAIHEEVGEDQV